MTSTQSTVRWNILFSLCCSHDKRFSEGSVRGKNWEKLEEIVEEIFADKTSEEWTQILQDHGVAAGPVNTAKEVFFAIFFSIKHLFFFFKKKSYFRPYGWKSMFTENRLATETSIFFFPRKNFSCKSSNNRKKKKKSIFRIWTPKIYFFSCRDMNTSTHQHINTCEAEEKNPYLQKPPHRRNKMTICNSKFSTVWHASRFGISGAKRRKKFQVEKKIPILTKNTINVFFSQKAEKKCQFARSK